MTNGTRKRSLARLSGDDDAEPVAISQPIGWASGDDDADLDEQDVRHLGPAEAEDPQRRQLARPLGELDAGAVVDDAEGDDDASVR